MTPIRIAIDAGRDSDVLGRSPAAQSLVDTLMLIDDSEGAVVGLQGAWGSGKTWLLNETKKKLDAMPIGARPTWVEFSPWSLSGSDALVEALIKEIGAQIKVKASQNAQVQQIATLGDRLLEYSEHVAVIRHLAIPAAMLNPALGAFVGVLGHGAQMISDRAKDARPLWDRLKTAALAKYPPPPEGRPSLLELRERVEDALNELTQPVIVVLDDLDRMTPKEVADIIQTVKAVARFRKVIYVLAYDPQVIAEALESALPLSAGMGQRYLEKIIQVPVTVPQPPRFLLKDAVQRAFDDALRFANWAPIALFTNDLSETNAIVNAAAMMETPRDVNRLRVRLQIAFKALRDEICPTDLLLLEALQLKCPAVVDWVEAHHSEILRSAGAEHDLDYQARGSVRAPDSHVPLDGDPSSVWRQELIQNDRIFSTTRGPTVNKVLTILFDAYGNASRPSVGPFRAQLLRNWIRWLAQVGHEKVLENTQMISMLESTEPVDASALWADLQAFDAFDVRAQIFIPTLAGDRLERMAALYLAALQHFGVQAMVSSGIRISTRPQNLLWPVLNRCTELDPEDLYSPHTCDHILERVLNAGFCTVALDALKLAERLWSNQRSSNRRQQWIEATMLVLASPQACLRSGDDPIYLAFYVCKWSSPRRTFEDVLGPMFESDPQGALAACFDGKDMETLKALLTPAASVVSTSLAEDPAVEQPPAAFVPIDVVLRAAARVPDLYPRFADLATVLWSIEGPPATPETASLP